MKNFVFALTLLLLIFSCNEEVKKNEFPIYKMLYDEPALYFEETLVLGNGQMGATVFGGVKTDQIYLNHSTLWSGEPIDSMMNSEAYKYIPEIREALKNEDYKKADELQKNIQGKFSESYAPLGTLKLLFNHADSAINYKRELSLNDAITSIQYQIDGVEYSREYFVSYPNKVMVIKLEASEKDALNFDVLFESQLNHKIAENEDVLEAYGNAPVNSEPSYRGDVENAVVFENEKGTRFATMIKAVNTDGEVTCEKGRLQLINASKAELIVSIATSFNGFDKDPAKDGKNCIQDAENQLTKAANVSFEVLREAHLDDYHNLFNRVSLSFGEEFSDSISTDDRLLKYAKGADDKYLEALYFQYGRYLLISSSRTPSVPANLQGIWNPYMRPPWSCNYTTNINVEENYWLAEVGNLPETHQSLLGFISNLAQTGRYSAKHFLGIKEGWMVAHNSDIWAMSNPVGDFGNGDPVWANWYMGGAWLSTHLWEHYLFSQDSVYLREFAYDLMKGAAQFCLGCLVDDGKGNLVTSPSTSPENKYVTNDGYVGATLYGSTSDLAMVRSCFINVIEASKRLNIDTIFRQKVQTALEKLYPYQIGKDGSLQEWYHDWKDEDPWHRHQSHLFGLHPGHHISPEKTPQLADACQKALEIKGDETTGWSKGWRINLWARLLDGDRAYKMYRELLRYVEPDEIRTNHHGGGTYPNLFDAHPPFQIDGNFGGAAAVIEMLLQSDENEIQLLPALPSAWPSGEIKGIKARGGFEVSIKWENGELVQTKVKNIAGNSCLLYYNGNQVKLSIPKGDFVILNSVLKEI